MFKRGFLLPGNVLLSRSVTSTDVDYEVSFVASSCTVLLQVFHFALFRIRFLTVPLKVRRQQ